MERDLEGLVAENPEDVLDDRADDQGDDQEALSELFDEPWNPTTNLPTDYDPEYDYSKIELNVSPEYYSEHSPNKMKICTWLGFFLIIR